MDIAKTLADIRARQEQRRKCGDKMFSGEKDCDTLLEIIDQLQEKSAQAYQVVGYLDEALFGDAEKPSDSEMLRVMNYFCDPDTFNDDFLPWPIANALNRAICGNNETSR